MKYHYADASKVRDSIPTNHPDAVEHLSHRVEAKETEYAAMLKANADERREMRREKDRWGVPHSRRELDAVRMQLNKDSRRLKTLIAANASKRRRAELEANPAPPTRSYTGITVTPVLAVDRVS